MTAQLPVGQGYVDPNRKEQGSSMVLGSAMKTVINRVIPTPDENGSFKIDRADVGLLFGPESINNTIQLSKNINPIALAAHLKELTMQEQIQARGETPTIAQIDEMPYFKTTQGVDDLSRLGGGPLVGEPLNINNLHLLKDLEHSSESVDYKPLPVNEYPVGEQGKVGLKGDDDSGLTTPDIKTRKQKRKKSKPKSNHLPNCKSKIVKATLGAAILGRLGKIQQTTADAVKKEVLKDVPLSQFVELMSGKELPAYQKRLLDLQQARAEGTLKPELESLGTKAPALEKVETIYDTDSKEVA